MEEERRKDIGEIKTRTETINDRNMKNAEARKEKVLIDAGSLGIRV